MRHFVEKAGRRIPLLTVVWLVSGPKKLTFAQAPIRGDLLLAKSLQGSPAAHSLK